MYYGEGNYPQQPVLNYKLQPGVYFIQQIEKAYSLFPESERFILPPKIYGNKKYLALRFWNTFAKAQTSVGAMFTGASGSGKTELARVIGNYGIDAGLPVIVITDIQADMGLVKFINSLSDCVVILDEFTKNFNYQMQEKMLTMFSDITGKKKMFIITENNKNTISEYIRNRPGRIKFRVDFSRIDRATIDEYCADFNVDKEFYNALIEKYECTTVFSFDHLKALITEHLDHPEDSLDYLLEILNLDILTKEKSYMVKSVTDLKTQEEVKFRQIEINKTRFDNGGSYWLELLTEPYDSTKIETKDVVSIKQENGVDVLNLKCENKYLVKLIIADDSDDVPSDAATHQAPGKQAARNMLNGITF